MPDDPQQEQRSAPGPRASPVRVQAWADRERCGIPWKAHDTYLQHWANAHRRGVAWEFDLPGWWAVWTEGGGSWWKYRGRKHRSGICLVMARLKDKGLYAHGKVYIGTPGDNAYDRPPHKRREAAQRALQTRRAREARMANCLRKEICFFMSPSVQRRRCACRAISAT